MIPKESLEKCNATGHEVKIIEKKEEAKSRGIGSNCTGGIPRLFSLIQIVEAVLEIGNAGLCS